VINPDYDERALEHTLKTWWQNPRKIGGLMLSHVGNKAFEAADIQFQEHVLSAIVMNKYNLIMMDRLMICPHYVDFTMMITKNGKPTIRIYDERVSLMIDLHGGFVEYFASLSRTVDE
jgi:hypothetical protein